jgi:hypothetical protein
VEVLLAVILGGVAGIVGGFFIGARYTFGLLSSGRAIRSAGARMALLMPQDVPTRTAEDILAGRVRIQLGITTFVLPVLPRGPSRRWLESLDQRFINLGVALSRAKEDPTVIIETLTTETDALYELLLSYDQTSVLPPRDELEEFATDAQILHAVLEVWRAAHPLVATVAAESRTSGASSEPQTI